MQGIGLVKNWITEIARQVLRDLLGYWIARIDWLSGSGKKVGSMVVQFTQKADVDKVLAKSVIDVEGKNTWATL